MWLSCKYPLLLEMRVMLNLFGCFDQRTASEKQVEAFEDARAVGCSILEQVESVCVAAATRGSIKDEILTVFFELSVSSLRDAEDNLPKIGRVLRSLDHYEANCSEEVASLIIQGWEDFEKISNYCTP